MSERGLAFSISELLPKLFLLAYVDAGVDKDLTNLVLANAAAVTFVCAIYEWNTVQSG
jgi:hypothetical protein